MNTKGRKEIVEPSAAHYFLLLLLFLSAITVVGQFYMLIPYGARIARHFGVEPASTAWASSLFGYGYAAGLLFFGTLVDRFGPRLVLIAGLVSMAAATQLVGLATTFELFLTARLAQGLLAGSVPLALIAVATYGLPDRLRIFGVSLVSFSFLAAAPVTQWLVAHLSVTLLTLMSGYVAVYLLLALLVSRAHLRPYSHSAPYRFWPTVAILARNKNVRGAWIAAPSVMYAFIAFFYGVQHFAEPYQLDAQLLRLVGLPPLLMAFAAVPVNRRYGAVFTGRLGLLLITTGMALSCLGPGLGLLAGAAVVSMGVAMAVPGLIATASINAGPDRAGIAVGMYACLLFIGGGIAPLTSQWLSTLGYVPVYLVSALLAAVSSLALPRGAKTSP